ncbi:hypothetical protein COCON_G00064760 [Conger conger]|uniref:Uncharacterized protein n=1 Tax=Conger conger TaxID=82655 RepID=A0A9Q1I3U7_CONCO|nr:hypothetical protein COCON_G00064760 [Conger conger]
MKRKAQLSVLRQVQLPVLSKTRFRPLWCFCPKTSIQPLAPAMPTLQAPAQSQVLAPALVPSWTPGLSKSRKMDLHEASRECPKELEGTKLNVLDSCQSGVKVEKRAFPRFSTAFQAIHSGTLSRLKSLLTQPVS